MRAATFPILVGLFPLLSVEAADSEAPVVVEEAQAYPAAAARDPLYRPGLCRPLIELPARVTDVWAEIDAARQEAALAAQEEAETGEPTEDAIIATELPETADGETSDDHDAPLPEPEPVVELEADKVQLQREGLSELQGNVWLQQGEQFLNTDHLVFDSETGVIEALAPSRFGSRQLVIDADHAIYDTSIGQGRFEQADFYLLGRNARGEADLLARTGEATARIEGVKYTSCPPEDEDWWLKASSMDLDQEEGVGTARNVRVAFMGVPFFYTPWISFPLDERRKTGFLFPEFGDSGRVGAWLRLPYYLNLDPQYDATITPYYMSERGTMLETQFRYLFGWGSGGIRADYLDNDEQTDTERYYYRLDHRSVIDEEWSARIFYREVSDTNYFQDLSSSGRGTSILHLSQFATLQRSELEWGTSLLVQQFQTIDPSIPESRQPYKKWPQVGYYWSPLPYDDWLWLSIDGNSINFQRDNRLNGWRHHTETAFSTDIGNPGLRLTPRVAWWHTEYDLEDVDLSPVEHSRAAPVASLDALARFARPLSSGGQQALEPRLFYVYIPYREQDEFPRFDTRNVSDTLASLFRENRFTGPDRLGDQDRVSFSLTTALTNAFGREWLSAAIARAWYLDDREVQLTETAEDETRRSSNYYAAVDYRPTNTQQVSLDANWDPESEKYDAGSIQYRYQPAYDTVLQLAYRYRRFETTDPLEQVDFSFATPLASRWRLFGRAVYSLEEERSQETLAGFEYENCCWVFRTFNRRHIFNRDGEFDQGIWFQLELKGLSSVGRRIDEFLQEDIYGYGETL